jgi:hypothetical protein
MHNERVTLFGWFCTSVYEECSISEEIARDVKDLLDLVGHGCVFE